jgi:hypothetical protein
MKKLPMELKIDIEKYENLQEIFVAEIIQQIRLKLLQAGITGDELFNLTGEIAFSVTSTLDGNAMLERDGTEVNPYLVFSGEEDQIIHCGENSFTHEFVASEMDKAFSSKGA